MDTISQIKQALDIVDVVGSYISLKKSGHSYKGLCPFHADHNPSFMVSQELQIYKCFVCNDGGDIFKFVQKIEGVDFGTALEQLAERAGIKLEKKDFDPQTQAKKQIYVINELTAKFYQYILHKLPAGKVGLDYLKDQRRLKESTIRAWLLGYAPENPDLLKSFLLKKGYTEQELLDAGVIVHSSKGADTIDKFRGRIIFPLTGIDGRILGFMGRTIFNREPKYLNTTETPVFHKGSFVFGLNVARIPIKTKGVVLVEGTLDVISGHEAGIDNVVAVSGTSLTDNQLRVLQRYTTDMTFCFDSDVAGSLAVHRAVEMAERLNFNIKVAVVPKPYKDLDEIVKSDLKRAKTFLVQAVPAYDFFLLDALKKHDKNTALGKKSIVDELSDIFSRVSNPVLIEHYAQKIAEELGLSEDAVLSVFRKTDLPKVSYTEQSSSTAAKLPGIDYKTVPEGYILALLFKADIDMQREYAYKLHPEDFENPVLLSIFNSYIEYLQKDTKSFNIKSVEKALSDEEKSWVADLYIWDLDERFDFGDKGRLEKELESTFKRIRKDSARKALKELTEKIKLAELGNDFDQVAKLSKKVEKLKKLLI